MGLLEAEFAHSLLLNTDQQHQQQPELARDAPAPPTPTPTPPSQQRRYHGGVAIVGAGFCVDAVALPPAPLRLLPDSVLLCHVVPLLEGADVKALR